MQLRVRYFMVIAVCVVAFSACTKEKTASTSDARLDYVTRHFSLSLPATINRRTPSLMTKIWKDDELNLSYSLSGDDAYNISINVSRAPLKGNTDIAMWTERIPNKRAAKIEQGIEGTVFISDLHDFPIEGTRDCSLGYVYAFPVLKSLYTISFSRVQRDVRLDSEEVWKKECTLLGDAEHEKFMQFMKVVMDSFQLDEPS